MKNVNSDILKFDGWDDHDVAMANYAFGNSARLQEELHNMGISPELITYKTLKEMVEDPEYEDISNDIIHAAFSSNTDDAIVFGDGQYYNTEVFNASAPELVADIKPFCDDSADDFKSNLKGAVGEESASEIISGIEVWENMMMRLYHIMAAKYPDRFFFFSLCECVIAANYDVEDIEDENVKNYLLKLYGFGIKRTVDMIIESEEAEE